MAKQRRLTETEKETECRYHLTCDVVFKQLCQGLSGADLGRGGGGGGRGAAVPHFSCIFEKFLTLSLTFGHKCSQNDAKQHHQFLRPPISGFFGSAPDYTNTCSLNTAENIIIKEK